MSIQGQNLIFLISQPRSGSTMTQRVLGSHSAIHTQSEPWILLHPLHAAKPVNIVSAFDSKLYSLTLDEFIKSLPGGPIEYRNAIANAYGSLYDSILNREKKSIFLDKTPRYYHIIDELSLFFPAAKFIFLFRNPAAVFSSIHIAWIKEEWNLFSLYRDDLLNAPSLMLRGIKMLGSKAIAVKYEDIVDNPEVHFTKLCNFLGISFEPQMISYGKNNLPQWRYGDKTTIYKNESPDHLHKDEWKKSLKISQQCILIKQYIEYLGKGTLEQMGYDYQELMGLVHENIPQLTEPKIGLDLMTLLNDEFSGKMENYQLKSRIESQKRLIISLENQILSLNEIEKKKAEEIESLTSFTAGQKKILAEKEIELSNIRESVRQIESILAEKSHQVTLNQVKIQEQKVLLEEKEKINQTNAELIRQQQDLLKGNTSLLTKFTDSLNEARQQISNLEKLLDDTRHSLQESNSELKARDEEITRNAELIVQIENHLEQCKESSRMKDGQITQLNQIQIRLNEIISQKKLLLDQIEKSYTFRIGRIILWPFKVLFRRKKHIQV